MINRVNDYNIFSDDEFDKISNVINKVNQKSLYKTCENEDEVEIAQKELSVIGYNSTVNKIGKIYNVYKILPERIELSEATKSGNFKKLAWGRYCFQKCNSVNGFNDYNFDDGSIWRIITDSNGKQYLVKDIKDNNEDEVIRHKTNKIASLEKTASDIYYISDNNYKIIFSIIYTNDSDITNSVFFQNIMQANDIKASIYKMLNDKFDELLDEKLQQQAISQDSTIQSFKQYISDNINNGNIIDINSFTSYVNARFQEIANAQGVL